MDYQDQTDKAATIAAGSEEEMIENNDTSKHTPRRGFKVFTPEEYSEQFDVPVDVVRRLIADGALPTLKDDPESITYLYDPEDGEEIITRVPEDLEAEMFHERLAEAVEQRKQR